MAQTTFDTPSILFRDSSRPVPVGKIICLGRNYADHASEMNAPLPASPVLFLKPPSAILHDGGTVVRPAISKEMHYEAEMVLAIGRGGKAIPEAAAMDHIAGYGVGLDMTLRDLQDEAKQQGLPWAIAKGFDTSAPVSTFVPGDAVSDPHELTLSLTLNGELRQNARTSSMIFRCAAMIRYISLVFTLEPGDLIFTGTPKGVGPVSSGDRLKAELESVGSVEVRIA